ncbi:hypothetical protein HMPREF2724_06535 [Corynebacterium sp. HMSC071F07]|uniref:hypothetical protein n=1 Tax=Corynebacterium sp. HMSC071F07 TaxID=1715203 RepID=UPI0008A2F689|nr:hypothetical protein [Corynebacterium sp. HMSC071F07]OFM02028.1 hypothetical protein HMPREF2724_06535 [Corynebacterium sp. HMSC071F07]
MIYQLICELERNVDNIRSWDNHYSEKRVVEAAPKNDQISFLKHVALPWYEKIAQTKKIVFKIVAGEITGELKEELYSLSGRYPFVVFQSIIDTDDAAANRFQEDKWREPLALLPIVPWQLYTEQALDLLASEGAQVGRTRCYTFESNYCARSVAQGFKRIRKLEAPSMVVSVSYSNESDPRAFSYKSLDAAAYYHPIIHVSNCPGFLLAAPAINEQLQGSIRPLDEYEEQALPYGIRELLIEPRREIVVDEPARLADTIEVSTDITGPFELETTLELGEGIKPKSALFSFDLVDFDGRQLSTEVEIEGLACSPSPAIGFFFYLLSSNPGINTFTHKIQLPESVRCVKIKLLRWGNSDAAIALNSLAVKEN